MTVETRSTIGLKDITAIEFQCKKCGTKVIRPIETLEKPPADCPNCQAQFYIYGSQEHANLHHFLQRIKTYAQTDDGNLAMRFEVSGLKP